MRGTQSVPWPRWLWLPFANRRDLATDQRLMAAQQLWLGSTHWPLQPDFILGVLKKTFRSHQESVVVLGAAGEAAATASVPSTQSLLALLRPKRMVLLPMQSVVEGQPVRFCRAAGLGREAACLTGVWACISRAGAVPPRPHLCVGREEFSGRSRSGQVGKRGGGPGCLVGKSLPVS